jgi:hypothetical protein
VFTLHVYLNCLSKATVSRFLPRWSALPWVQVIDNTVKAARLNLRKGETIVSPERSPRVRNLANENCDELWSNELLRLESQYVGTVDADLEVLAPDFFFAALDELEPDAAVAGCSTDHSDISICSIRSPTRTVCLKERWHTHFCLYRRSALARSTISHFRTRCCSRTACPSYTTRRLTCSTTSSKRTASALPACPGNISDRSFTTQRFEAEADGSAAHPEDPARVLAK